MKKASTSKATASFRKTPRTGGRGKSKPSENATAKQSAAELEGQLRAINGVMAVISFSADGKILDANDNFLKTVGYSLDEIRGQHHSMFVEPGYCQSHDYRQFWDKLARGEFETGQYKRLGRGGREIWLQASYNPVLGPNGKPVKVIKFATDITDQKIRVADYEGQIAAIGKVMAVITFTLDGKILDANDNFLKTVGYGMDEIRGQHHSLFVEPAYRQSHEYRLFWDKLGRGEFDTGQYRRIGRGGSEIWLQASYNPIFNADGKPIKVIKYASDITEQIKASRMLQAAVDETQKVVGAARNHDLGQRVAVVASTACWTRCRALSARSARRPTQRATAILRGGSRWTARRATSQRSVPASTVFSIP